MVCRVFSRASTGNARRFLEAILADMPFPVQPVQVDGGSEFMAGFEAECEARELPLFALPPRRSQWNGQVERCNDSLRLEFRALWTGDLTVSAVSRPLVEQQRWHNARRPHAALDYRPPLEHLEQLENAQMTA